MNRENLLRAAALAVVASGLVLVLLHTPVPLTDCREVVEDSSSSTERHVIFSHDGAEVLAMSVQASPYTPGDPGQVIHRLLVSIAHPRGTHVDAVAVDIRFPQTRPGDVYLEVPGDSLYPRIDVNRPPTYGGFDRRIAIADTGMQGESTMTFVFLVRQNEDADHALQLSVDIETTLSESDFPWRRYAAQHQIPIEI